MSMVIVRTERCCMCKRPILPGERTTESRVAHTYCALVELATLGRDVSKMVRELNELDMHEDSTR